LGSVSTANIRAPVIASVPVCAETEPRGLQEEVQVHSGAGGGEVAPLLFRFPEAVQFEPVCLCYHAQASNELTGFGKGAICPVGMNTPIPVILSDRLLQLDPPFMWLGGGHVRENLRCLKRCGAHHASLSALI
jgi:hypothetical protein